ncbi:MAG: hypothetical protein AB1487_04720 [Thermodesulfobacteriota bacterium]
MHPTTSFQRLKIKRLSCVIFFFLFFVFFCPLIVQAGELRGQVFGEAGDLKRYVRITLIGPKPITTFTDDEGIFVINAPNGEYKLIISEKGNEQVFKVVIPGKDKFKVAW